MLSKALLPLTVGFVALAFGAPASAEGDPAAGKRVFNQCSACHSLTKGRNGLGPSLYGVVGRKAATAEGFKNYSPAMQKSGIVWTEENLSKYLEDPRAFIPANRMILNGLKKQEDRDNVIAFIKQSSQGESGAGSGGSSGE